MKTVLVTGGAGFVGSHLALHLKAAHPSWRLLAMDNLHRRGSELNLARLAAGGVEFVHGDIRCKEDFPTVRVDALLECSAEPSVLAGTSGDPGYLIQSNLVGTLHCLELARRHGSDVVFLSSSRVYPVHHLRSLHLVETATRMELHDQQELAGVSPHGVSEAFPLDGPRTLYGATKLSSELMVTEYGDVFGLRTVINRCGVLAGPWQFGKQDQGFVALWVARHILGGALAYVGYGGQGKQVRDILHVLDLCDLVDRQLDRMDDVRGRTLNVGGGRAVSVSLLELTQACARVTGRNLHLERQPETRAGDVPLFITDARLVERLLDWKPRRPVETVVEDIAAWIHNQRDALAPVLGAP
jgi:CDP-paratose 2-epimerase